MKDPLLYKGSLSEMFLYLIPTSLCNASHAISVTSCFEADGSNDERCLIFRLDVLSCVAYSFEFDMFTHRSNMLTTILFLARAEQ